MCVCVCVCVCVRERERERESEGERRVRENQGGQPRDEGARAQQSSTKLSKPSGAPLAKLSQASGAVTVG